MEKGKELEKEIKVKNKEEKETREEETIVFEKREKKLVKFIALLSSFFATAMALLIFIFSIITCISVSSLDKELLINNNIVVTIISKLNNYSVLEVTELINGMSNRFTFILFQIVIICLYYW